MSNRAARYPVRALALCLLWTSACHSARGSTGASADVQTVSSALQTERVPGTPIDTPTERPVERVAVEGTPPGITGDPPCSHVPGTCCVALQPLGDVEDDALEAVRAALIDLYSVEVRQLEPVELPESAWYPPRRRWRAERLLDFLEPRLPADCDRIMGVAAEDISTTKGEHEDWGILGLADLPGTASVISSYRCRRRVEDVPPLERLGRVAVHELGHSLGLPHCPTYGCFLEDAGGTVETIDRETFLCDVCQRRLGWVE